MPLHRELFIAWGESMSRRYIPVSLFLLVCSILAGATEPAKTRTTVCTFEDGKQISLQYPSAPADKKLNWGDVWSPAGQPIYLFSQADLQAGDTTLPAKAYRIYLVPGKESWTLIVNDNVEKDAAYSKEHDVARLTMDTGKLPSEQKEFQMALGRTGPKHCSIRVYYGPTGAFASMDEK